MKQLELENRKESGLNRRQLMANGLLGLTAWVFNPLDRAYAAIADDLEKVSRGTRMPDHEGSLLVLQDFKNDPDVEIERHLRRQLPRRQDLLQRIQQKIGFEKRVGLSIEAIQVRLLFTPQSREDTAKAYLRYCRDITDRIFRVSGMDSFYAAITCPEASFPPIAASGITAFLIHRLVKEFQAVCKFTAESGESIKYTVSGAIYSNHLGAVDLEIQATAPGRYELARKPYTIWQNDTADLYTLMAIPIEETLHYLLGVATDRQLRQAMQVQAPQSLADARALAEEWMAVEESVVGGVVDQLLRIYCTENGISLPAPRKDDPRTVPPLRQYRYRQRGLQVVADMGFQDAMALYLESPTRYRRRL